MVSIFVCENTERYQPYQAVLWMSNDHELLDLFSALKQIRKKINNIVIVMEIVVIIVANANADVMMR